MAEWAAGRVGLHFIPPGEPWRNGYIESFNSRHPRRMPEHTPGWAHQRPRCPGRWSCRGVSAPSLRDPQSFLSPKALDLLVIHAPAFAAGIVIRRPETATGMDLGVLAQPGQ